MSHNSFGHLFRVTTWGESHGRRSVVWSMVAPPRLRLMRRICSRGSIVAGLDNRNSTRSAGARPGCDMSGVFDGRDDRTPIALMNRQCRPNVRATTPPLLNSFVRVMRPDLRT